MKKGVPGNNWREKIIKINSAVKDWGEERGLCPHCQIELVPLDQAGMPVYCLRCELDYKNQSNKRDLLPITSPIGEA